MTLKILMITRIYPYPAQSGDLIYTAGLIGGLSADPDIALSVFCGNGLPSVSQELAVKWFGTHGYASRKADLAALIGPFPRAAERALPKAAMAQLSAVLAQNQFDLVLLNDSCTVKALALVQAVKLPVIYLSHNVVSDILPEIAAKVISQPRRWLQMRDAEKYQRLEPEMVKAVSGLTAITEEDLKRYSQLGCCAPCAELKPGYQAMDRIEPLEMRQRKRVAVLVGSFEWNAKISNLREILAAYARYRSANTGDPFILRVTGKASPVLLKRLRLAYPDVELTGSFDHIEDVILDARVALALEELGGGFKLKTLDYIFSHLAIVGFSHALAGSDLQPNKSYVAAVSFDDAMTKIHDLMSNFERLDALTKAAYERAQKAYNWEDRIAKLISLIREAILFYQSRNLNDKE